METRKSLFRSNLPLGTGKMVQWVKSLVVKTDGLSSIPGTHTLEGENQLLPVVL